MTRTIALPERITALGVPTADGIHVALGGGRVVRVRGDQLDDVAVVTGGPDLTELVETSSGLHAGGWLQRKRYLWQLTPEVRRVSGIDGPAITVCNGELVHARRGQIYVGKRALIDLPGKGPEVELELDHKIYGRTKGLVDDVRGVLARVEMARTMVCTTDHVFYDTVGDTTTHDRIYAVPLAGGKPIVWLEGKGEDGYRGVAVTNTELVVIAQRVTNLAKYLAAAVERRPLAAREPVTRMPLPAGRVLGLQALGDVVLWRRDDVVEASIAGSAPQRIGQGKHACLAPGGTWIANGTTLEFVSARGPSSLSARAQQVIDAIRAVGGAFEKTTVAGQPAIAIAAHGGRVMKVVTEAELAEIEAAL